MRVPVWIFVFTLALLSGVRGEKPLNILLLYADDWRHDVLGIAGHPVVKTPVLDRLAAEGVRFTNSFVTTSICEVSRASLLTGQWMSRHGALGHGAFKTPWSQTFPGLLRSSGHHVGLVGKWHGGPFPRDEFDFGRDYGGKHWFELADGRRVHVTARNEEDALEFLDVGPREKPFCLTVAFFAPHAEDPHPDQYLPQPSSLELYRDVEIPVPGNATEESWKRLPPFFTKRNAGRVRWRWRFDTPEKYQEMMKNYFRLITEIDTACGRILEELERQGVLDRTLVIFTTDNGYFHGEHGLADKWYPYQESIRVPLILRDPRLPARSRGRICDSITLNVDLAPTILAAAGLRAPRGMQGRDLAPLYLEDDPPPWRDEFFYEHPTHTNRSYIPASQALVRRDWKYLYWPDYDHEQLFHLEVDPREERDLARIPAHADRLTRMRERLKTRRESVR